MFTLTKLGGRDTKETAISRGRSAKLSFMCFTLLDVSNLSHAVATVLYILQHVYHIYIYFFFMDLREYPRAFGVRFAHTMKYFQKERAMVTYRNDDANWLQLDWHGWETHMFHQHES